MITYMQSGNESLHTEDIKMVKVKRILLDILHVRRTLLVLFLPFILLLLPLQVDTPEAKCGYGLILMGILWITESLPLAATALLPVIIFPILGVQRASEVSGNYIKDSSMFGFGGLTIAIAVEKWKLHKRIALKALLLVGSEPKWLMLGFMLPTWFLSMWVSNTATTAMMIPIVDAVMEELKEVKQSSEKESNITMDTIDTSNPDGAKIDINIKEEADDSGDEFNNSDTSSKPGISSNLKINSYDESRLIDESPEYVRMCKGMALCIAYAANVGGTGSLSGTGPNIVMQGQADLLFQQYGYANSGVNFASWMVFALPGSVICVFLTWVWLSLYFLGWRGVIGKRREKEKDKRVRSVIAKAYQQLGPMSFAEKSVLTHFVVLILLWFFRSPPQFDGWGTFFKSGYVGDSAAAILICLSLFTFPSERPTVLCFRKRNVVYTSEERPRGPVPPLLDWYTVEKKFPWGVLLLIGGGFALADASEKSGLSALIGEQLEVFSDLEPWAMNLVLTIIIALCTEVTSNTATSTLLLPIMGNLALRLNMNPLYLMFPCVISTSFAFMLPVATPPNAIVFATGYLTVRDMVMAGSVMNILCVAVLALEANTWGMAFFQLDQLPSGFNRTQNNSSLISI